MIAAEESGCGVNQIERTEAVIAGGLKFTHQQQQIQWLEDHARDLARRLDAVMPEVFVALLDRCYCEEVDDEDFDEQEQCEYCLRIAKLRAIVEGTA